MMINKSTRYFLATAALVTTSLFMQTSHAQSDPLYKYEQLNGTNPNNVAKPGKIESTEAPFDKKVKDKDNNLQPQSIPLDGGLSLFLVAGAGIAAKKRYDKKKAQAQL